MHTHTHIDTDMYMHLSTHTDTHTHSSHSMHMPVHIHNHNHEHVHTHTHSHRPHSPAQTPGHTRTHHLDIHVEKDDRVVRVALFFPRRLIRHPFSLPCHASQAPTRSPAMTIPTRLRGLPLTCPLRVFFFSWAWRGKAVELEPGDVYEGRMPVQEESG